MICGPLKHLSLVYINADRFFSTCHPEGILTFIYLIQYHIDASTARQVIQAFALLAALSQDLKECHLEWIFQTDLKLLSIQQKYDIIVVLL